MTVTMVMTRWTLTVSTSRALVTRYIASASGRLVFCRMACSLWRVWVGRGQWLWRCWFGSRTLVDRTTATLPRSKRTRLGDIKERGVGL